MTTRIGTAGVATGVAASQSAPRVTATPARPFSAVMSASASAILLGAEQAVTRLPGGPILAAAFRPSAIGGGPALSQSAAGLGVTSGGHAAAAPVMTPEGSAGAGGEAGFGGAAGSGQDLESVMSEGADQNLYWLRMQERVNAESRDYSAMSNLLKARHETIKNAIGNIR